MNENNSQISIEDLYKELFISKFYVISIAVITLIICILAFFLIKDNWKGSLKIYALSSIDFEQYSKLSEYEDIFKSNPNYLRSLLIEEIDDREEIRKIIEKLGMVKPQDFENNVSYSIALRKKSFVFEILEIESDDLIEQVSDDTEFDFQNRDFYTVEFTSQNKSEIDEVFRYVLNEANKNVNIYLKNKLLNFSENYQTYLDYKRADKIKKYDRYIEKKLAFLKEQLEIAKLANINNNSILSKDFETDSQVTAVTTIEKDQPYYYRGSIAIQKEIELIESRTEKALFLDTGLPELIDDEEDVFVIDDTVDRIVNAFNLSPIQTDAFKSANYDIGNIEYKKQGITRNILIFASFLCGLILTIIIIAFKTFIRKVN